MDAVKINTLPIILSICIVIVFELVARKLSLPPLMATGLIRIIDILMIFGVFHLSSNGADALGLTSRKIRHGFKKGVLWSVIFGLISGGIGLALFLIGINPMQLIHVQIPKEMSEIVLFFIVGGIISPIAEEMFFRGVIYGYLRNFLFAPFGKWGIFFAVLFSTLLFVTAHTGTSGIPLPQIAGGFLFCLSYEVEKSLITPIIIHSFGNMALFALSLYMKV